MVEAKLQNLHLNGLSPARSGKDTKGGESKGKIHTFNQVFHLNLIHSGYLMLDNYRILQELKSELK